jgi:hypothetical protein
MNGAQSRRPRVKVNFATSLLLCLACTAAAASSSPAASRPASEGCRWKPFRSQTLGVSLLVEACSRPESRYVFSVVGNRIEQHRPADDVTYVGPIMMEFFTKPAAMSIEKAIEAQFVAKLPPEARRSCRVVPYRYRGNTKPRYTLEPTGTYANKIYAELAQFPRDFGCGPYGAGQASAYFEYHPSESLERFAFVNAGQDAPLFDEESIRFER